MKRISIFILAAAAALSCSAPADLIVYNASDLAAARKEVRAGKASVKAAYEKLIDSAEKALLAEPVAVTMQGTTPPSGDKHDYMSQGPYWWPNPDTPDGLPYIRKDGQFNPEREKMLAKKYMGQTIDRVNTLALAYYYSGEEKYAQKASEFLRVFFLEPETRMNPNLNYGQGIPGICTGRGIGIIDTHGLGQMMDKVLLLDGSASWTAEDKAAFQAWVKEYCTWMRESEIGISESETENNHATAYDMQVCSFALYCGDVELAKNQLLNVTKARMDVQFPADASQPLELARTNSWGYSTGNLGIWMELSRIAEGLGIDIWEWRTADGVGLKDVVEWYLPFIRDGKPWVKEDINKTRGAGNLDKVFRTYCRKFGKERYPEFVGYLKSYCNDNFDFAASINNLTYPL